jgi:hypothetical protein
LSSRDGTNLNGDKPVLDGHYKDELWGLAWHPSKAEFATVGDDATLRIWDAKSYRQLRRCVGRVGCMTEGCCVFVFLCLCVLVSHVLPTALACQRAPLVSPSLLAPPFNMLALCCRVVTRDLM